MDKLEIIKTLENNGIFDLTQGILDTIKADTAKEHAAANKDLFNLIDSIHQMKNWTLFSWKTMIDLAGQTYGFTKYCAYNGLYVFADVVDDVEELHDLLWNNFKQIGIWND